MSKKVEYILYFLMFSLVSVITALIVYDASDTRFERAKTNLSEVLIDETQTLMDEYEEVKTDNKTIFVFEEIDSREQKNTKKALIPKEFIGLDKKEIEKAYKEWSIVDFSAEEVSFIRYIETPIPIYVLSSEDNEIVIYYKDENGNITIEEETGIFIDDFPTADIEKIKQGIVYEDKASVLKALQNYDS